MSNSAVITGRTHILVIFLQMSNRFRRPWTKHAGLATIEGWFLHPPFNALAYWDHRSRDCGEFAPYQRVVRRSVPSSSTAGDDRHARKTMSSLRPCGSRFGTVEERMSREVETFM